MIPTADDDFDALQCWHNRREQGVLMEGTELHIGTYSYVIQRGREGWRAWTMWGVTAGTEETSGWVETREEAEGWARVQAACLTPVAACTPGCVVAAANY